MAVTAGASAATAGAFSAAYYFFGLDDFLSLPFFGEGDLSFFLSAAFSFFSGLFSFDAFFDLPFEVLLPAFFTFSAATFLAVYSSNCCSSNLSSSSSDCSASRTLISFIYYFKFLSPETCAMFLPTKLTISFLTSNFSRRI